jgi:predicted transcriptional regulator
MDMIPLKPERKAQLEEYAKRRGQDPAAALDDALAAYLEWERQDFAEAAAGIRQGYENVRAGRTSPLPTFSRSCAASMTFRVETTAAAEQNADEILDGCFRSTPETPASGGSWHCRVP